jgi:5-methylcytosine-specific restriction endonuclease McrA
MSAHRLSFFWTFCVRCHALKPLEQMRADRRFKTGRRPMCEACQAASDRERRRARRWLSAYLKRARKFGFAPVREFLTPNKLIARWGDHCFYCPDGDFEEIDHVVSVGAGGHHVLDNVVPCCKKCNRLKRWTCDEAAIKRYRATQTQA